MKRDVHQLPPKPASTNRRTLRGMGSEPHFCPTLFTKTPILFLQSNTPPFHLNLLVPSQNFVSTQWGKILYKMSDTKISTCCDVRPKCCIAFANRTLCGSISSFFSSVFGLKPTLCSMLFIKTPFSSTGSKSPPFWIFCDFISPTLSKAWAPHCGVTTNHHQTHNLTEPDD